MKVFIFILSSLFSFSALAMDQSILETTKIKLTESASEIKIESPEFSSTVKKEKCSDSTIQGLKKEIQNVSSKSLPYKGKDAIRAMVFGKPKTIVPQSPLAHYIKNFAQHMITFKTQASIPCKRK